jgi:signal transduction histidine kinase
MSSRLSHELRTPIAVVKTSLENLALQTQKNTSSDGSTENNAYIERAQTGINTLNLILTNMSEATRLEQMLSSTDKIDFDLCAVVSGCVAGYQQVYGEYTFQLTTQLSTLTLHGSPEHIVQLLDKVIHNAVEFSQDKVIAIELNHDDNHAELLIHNNGILLPKLLSENLFDSMVSLRNHASAHKAKQEQPHLGLGLYIARLICQFHQGKISAKNHYLPDGVTIHISLPCKT